MVSCLRWVVLLCASFGATGCTDLLGIDEPSDGTTDAGEARDGDSTDASVYRGGDDAAPPKVPPPPADAGSPPDAWVDPDACSPSATVPTPPPYVPVIRQMACSSAQVNAFATACPSYDWTNPQCAAWFATPANVGCGACIRPKTDAGDGGGDYTFTGAAIYDHRGMAYVNIGGCDAIVDNSPSCADPFQRFAICLVDACSSQACQRATVSEMSDCFHAAQTTGPCVPYQEQFQSYCYLDYTSGPLTSSGQCSTVQGVVTAICGNGT